MATTAATGKSCDVAANLGNRTIGKAARPTGPADVRVGNSESPQGVDLIEQGLEITRSVITADRAGAAAVTAAALALLPCEQQHEFPRQFCPHRQWCGADFPSAAVADAARTSPCQPPTSTPIRVARASRAV